VWGQRWVVWEKMSGSRKGGIDRGRKGQVGVGGWGGSKHKETLVCQAGKDRDRDSLTTTLTCSQFSMLTNRPQIRNIFLI
jgi:hypothetical protein